MKKITIDPLIYQKKSKYKYKYPEVCCRPHEIGDIGASEECDHTSPWED